MLPIRATITIRSVPANNFGNPNGHIIRLKETGDSTEALTFTWDIYLFGAGADLDINQHQPLGH
jgi:secreted PhoX family phosphatase